MVVVVGGADEVVDKVVVVDDDVDVDEGFMVDDVDDTFSADVDTDRGVVGVTVAGGNVDVITGTFPIPAVISENSTKQER